MMSVKLSRAVYKIRAVQTSGISVHVEFQAVQTWDGARHAGETKRSVRKSDIRQRREVYSTTTTRNGSVLQLYQCLIAAEGWIQGFVTNRTQVQRLYSSIPSCDLQPMAVLRGRPFRPLRCLLVFRFKRYRQYNRVLKHSYHPNRLAATIG